MLFNSIEFIFIFLPISFLFFLICNKFSKSYALLSITICSIIFYYISSSKWIFLLFLIIITNFALITFIKKKIFLIIAIFFNIGILFFFKYSSVLFNNFIYNYPTSIIPLGISFYTFNIIVLLIDIYNKRIRQPKFLNVLFLVLFFPHLIAGPFLRYNNIIDQIKKKFCISYQKISFGTYLFVVGLSKKILIADNLGTYVDSFHKAIQNGQVPSFIQSFYGTSAFTFQLYFDFSGYSDMAIGLGLLFGIILPINFDSPLKSKNLIDFWKKWHITLTNYIKEFIYIPTTLFLIKKFKNTGLINKNIIHITIPTTFTFLVIGLWHGGTINFLIFGVYSGIIISINQIVRNYNLIPIIFYKKKFFNLFSYFFLFQIVNIGFVFFRSENLNISIAILQGLVGLNGAGIPNKIAEILPIFSSFRKDVFRFTDAHSSLTFIILIFLSIYITYFTKNLNDSQNFFKEKYYYHIKSKKVFLSVLFFILCILFINKESSFLYFNF